MFDFIHKQKAIKLLEHYKIEEIVKIRVTSNHIYDFNVLNALTLVMKHDLSKYYPDTCYTDYCTTPHFLRLCFSIIHSELYIDKLNSSKIYEEYLKEKNIAPFLEGDSNMEILSVEELTFEITASLFYKNPIFKVPMALLHLDVNQQGLFVEKMKEYGDFPKNIEEIEKLINPSQLKSEYFFDYIEHCFHEIKNVDFKTLSTYTKIEATETTAIIFNDDITKLFEQNKSFLYNIEKISNYAPNIFKIILEKRLELFNSLQLKSVQSKESLLSAKKRSSKSNKDEFLIYDMTLEIFKLGDNLLSKKLNRDVLFETSNECKIINKKSK